MIDQFMGNEEERGFWDEQWARLKELFTEWKRSEKKQICSLGEGEERPRV